jgi:hypothetical protein
VNLKDIRASYYEFSGKTSDLVRTLALSAIAIIWVFRVDSPDGPSVPTSLLVAGFFAVATLASDLLHYVVATAVWGGYSRKKDKEGVGEEDEFVAPVWLNWPAISFFVLKVVLLVVT